MAREPERPDLTEELAAVAAFRLARLRRANRIRAIFKADRTAGVDIRNANKAARLKRERDRDKGNR